MIGHYRVHIPKLICHLSSIFSSIMSTTGPGCCRVPVGHSARFLPCTPSAVAPPTSALPVTGRPRFFAYRHPNPLTLALADIIAPQRRVSPSQAGPGRLQGITEGQPRATTQGLSRPGGSAVSGLRRRCRDDVEELAAANLGQPFDVVQVPLEPYPGTFHRSRCGVWILNVR